MPSVQLFALLAPDFQAAGHGADLTKHSTTNATRELPPRAVGDSGAAAHLRFASKHPAVLSFGTGERQVGVPEPNPAVRPVVLELLPP